MSTPDGLSPSEEHLFRVLVRKKALGEISDEEMEVFEGIQRKRLEAVVAACSRESAVEAEESEASRDAYERVIDALKNYVEVVKSENPAWSTAEGKA